VRLSKLCARDTSNPSVLLAASIGMDPMRDDHAHSCVLLPRHVTSLYQKSCTCARKNAATSSEYNIMMQTCMCTPETRSWHSDQIIHLELLNSHLFVQWCSCGGTLPRQSSAGLRLQFHCGRFQSPAARRAAVLSRRGHAATPAERLASQAPTLCRRFAADRHQLPGSAWRSRRP
jgi:hypothetical protein